MKVAVETSFTKSEVLRKLGLTVKPGNFRTFDRAVRRLSIDITHFTGRAHGTSIPRTKRDISVYLVNDGTPINSIGLKKRLLKEELIENKCAICRSDPSWMGSPLNLILDHIDGLHENNQLENLRLLCPNCNSQQATFCIGKKRLEQKENRIRFCSCGRKLCRQNKTGLCFICSGNLQKIQLRKVERPSKDDLALFIANGTWVGIAKQYGVSDSTVRKWARQYALI